MALTWSRVADRPEAVLSGNNSNWKNGLIFSGLMRGENLGRFWNLALRAEIGEAGKGHG